MSEVNRLEVVVGDITRLRVDAIVNAANTTLLGGGGVDGAIHRAAGPGLLEECKKLGGCPVGEARITGGYDLPAAHVIHAVGPVYEDGRAGDADLLRSAYENSLRLAEQVNAETIAFPCISTGAYRYPKVEACHIATEAVAEWTRTHRVPEKVVFCCYSEGDAEIYRRRLAEMA